jgi:adenine-specific DNA-methyltransferase
VSHREAEVRDAPGRGGGLSPGRTRGGRHSRAVPSPSVLVAKGRVKLAPTTQKCRGGYYTPPFLARFLAEWAVRAPTDRVLEPSCGDGELLVAAARALERRGASRADVDAHLLGQELDPDEAAAARRRLASEGLGGTVRAGDFFGGVAALGSGARFDAIVGNPPFVRYQTFPEAHREPAFALMRAAGLRPTRLTNAWVPFVVAATTLLDDAGRLAMVLPAELLQVGYAGELRRFLSDAFHRITLFTFRKLVFADIQQEVVLLCADRAAEGDAGIATVEIDDPAELDRAFREKPPETKVLDHATEKWTRYFLSAAELALVRRVEEDPRITRLGAVAEVDVGVVTGLNACFVMDAAAAEARGATAFTIPVVSRSAQLAGARLSRRDHAALERASAPVRLLDLPDVPRAALPARVRRYLAAGEAAGWHTGFKCRTREPWWRVPSRWAPDAFLLRQIHHHPKLVLNGAGATSTDTIHRVRFRSAVDGPRITAAFVNSLTFAFSELVGRSYGGGVLGLEPTEAERLPVPLAGAEELSLPDVDRALRAGDVHRALAAADAVLLERALGLSRVEVETLRRVWEKLRDRRHGRKKRAAMPEAEGRARVRVQVTVGG